MYSQNKAANGADALAPRYLSLGGIEGRLGGIDQNVVAIMRHLGI
jgi:hypothetical protein